jgi:hypothetical protein
MSKYHEILSGDKYLLDPVNNNPDLREGDLEMKEGYLKA